jgi:hypothetical protein
MEKNSTELLGGRNSPLYSWMDGISPNVQLGGINILLYH